MRPIVSELIREVCLCIRYHSLTFRGRMPETVLLSGVESSERQILNAIREDARLQVELLEPLAALDHENVAALSNSTPGMWALAIGLSMRDVSSGRLRGAA